MSRRGGVVLLLVASVGGAVWALGRTGSADAPLAVELAEAACRSELRSVVTASGRIRARESVDIQAELAGVIEELLVVQGQRVAKGDVLLRLDATEAKADEAAARAEVLAAEAEARSARARVTATEVELRRLGHVRAATEASLRGAEIRLAQLADDLERGTALFAKQVVSREELDRVRRSHEVARADVAVERAHLEEMLARVEAEQAILDQRRAEVEAVDAQVALAEARHRRARSLLDKTVIRSRMDGVVVRLNVEEGERAVPGVLTSPEATLMTVSDLGALEAEVLVDETDIVGVALGAESELRIDALAGVVARGEVVEIADSPEEVEGARLDVGGRDFLVVIRLEQPPADIRPGFSAGASILVESRTDVVTVPVYAIVVRQPAASAAPSRGVFVVDAGRARFRPLELGITSDTEVEVLAGLRAGDELVVGGYEVLRDLREGDPVAPSRR